MVRLESAQVVMVKNAAQFGLGIVLWFVVGVAFAYGNVDDKFLGHKFWAGDEWRGQTELPLQATITGLAGVSVLYIINGAITERTQLLPYAVTTFLVMSFAWPVVVAWTWGGGFLSSMEIGFEDAGGVAVVHLFAGTFSLTALFFIGPRLGPQQHAPELTYSNPAYICIGSILYFLHLLFLNSVYLPDFPSRGTAIFNTWLSAGICCTVVTILGTLRNWTMEMHLLMVIRGFIGGAVLVSGVAWNMEAWAAFTFAVFGGVVLFLSIWLEDYYRLDDVTKAVSVHFTMGLFGTVGVGLWDKTHGGFHDTDGLLIGVQLAGALTITAWAAIFSSAIFSVCSLLHLIRVPANVEIEGLNASDLTLKGFTLNRGNQINPDSSRPIASESP